MKIEIKNRYDGEIIVCGKYEDIKECVEKNKNLQGADLQGAYLQGAYLQGADLQGAYLQSACLQGADLQGAYLQGAYLQGAYLQGAYLQSAYLQSAYLQGAYLQGAYLQGAYLQGAYLRGAYLRGAKYEEPLFLCDLYSLKLLPRNTILTFWKYLRNGLSPFQGMEYKVGKEYKFSDYDSDESSRCGKGGNVATLMWCLKDDPNADEFIEVEFEVKDIVAVPYVTDGKFRVKRLKVLKKINRKKAVKLLKDLMKNKGVKK